MSRILGDAALFYAKGDWRMNAKRKIIIDCDTGIDDALALMLALASYRNHSSLWKCAGGYRCGKYPKGIKCHEST